MCHIVAIKLNCTFGIKGSVLKQNSPGHVLYSSPSQRPVQAIYSIYVRRMTSSRRTTGTSLTITSSHWTSLKGDRMH